MVFKKRMDKVRVVLADDHPIVLMGVREVVEAENSVVVVGEAKNSTELVELYQQQAPDIAIADFNMPGDQVYGDGIKLVEYLLRSYSNTRILIFTMLSNPLILSSLYDLGVSGVVLKNGDRKEILVALRSIMRGKVYRGAHMQSANTVLTSKDDALGRVASLSVKEYEVLRHFVSGMSVGDIAQMLNRSVKTVSAQKISAMRKLDVDTDQALLIFCLKTNLFN